MNRAYFRNVRAVTFRNVRAATVLRVRLRGDNAVCVSAKQLLKICTCIASGVVSMSWAWPALRIVVQAS